MVPEYQLLDAAKAGDLQAAREAIDRGADVSFRDSNRVNSLFLACTNGHMRVAELLVEHGADVNAVFGKRKQTLMHWAAEHGSFGVMTFLLAHKADMNALRCDNATPLHLAAKGGHDYVAKMLRDRGAIQGVRKSYRRTPRGLVSEAGESEGPTLLTGEGARQPTSFAAEFERSEREPGGDSFRR